MTATKGSIILASDYNPIQTAVAKILGSGYIGSAGTLYGSGYGQTLASSQAVAGYIGSQRLTGTLIAASSGSIANLVSDIKKIAGHQGTTITLPNTLANYSTANLKTIAANDFTTLTSIVNTLFTSRFNIAAGQFSSETLSTGTRTTAWGGGSSSLSHSITVTFANADTARWFFIAGGKIQFSASRTGGSNTLQNSNWATMLTDMGVITLNYNSTSSSNASQTGTIQSSTGWFNLTTSPTTIYSHVGTSRYSTNSYTLSVARDSGSTQLIISITFLDAHTSVWSDTVDGTLTSYIVSLRPSGANVNIAAPTVNSPTVAM